MTNCPILIKVSEADNGTVKVLVNANTICTMSEILCPDIAAKTRLKLMDGSTVLVLESLDEVVKSIDEEVTYINER